MCEAMPGKQPEMMVLIEFFQEIDDKVVDWHERVIISEVNRLGMYHKRRNCGDLGESAYNFV